MSLDDNKALGKLFIESLGDANDILATTLMTDDARVIWMVRSQGLPLPDSMGRDDLEIFLVGAMRDFYPNGMILTVERTTAEEDRVLVEAESYADLGDGRIYNNRYVFALVIRDGKIAEMREYADFLHSWQMLFSG